MYTFYQIRSSAKTAQFNPVMNQTLPSSHATCHNTKIKDGRRYTCFFLRIFLRNHNWLTLFQKKFSLLNFRHRDIPSLLCKFDKSLNKILPLCTVSKADDNNLFPWVAFFVVVFIVKICKPKILLNFGFNHAKLGDDNDLF